jgi:26S proteasome regulatory subunit N12
MSQSSSANVSQVEDLLKKFKSSVQAKKDNEAKQLLTQLKIELTKFNLIPPFTAEKSSVIKQLSLAREVYEQGCLFSISIKDEKAFERNYNSLRVYYNDYRSILRPSEHEAAIIGLYLLFLLAENKLAEFHSELELVANQTNYGATNANHLSSPKLVRSISSINDLVSSPYIKFSIQLEQQLMEGAYSAVLNSEKQVPRPEYSVFLSKLCSSVRDKIADVAETAYSSYPLNHADKLLLCSASEVEPFAQKRGWKVDLQQNKIIFPVNDSINHNEIPSINTIQQTLLYATELEKIV